MKKELDMVFDKATKGSIRFKETGTPEEQIIRTIYVRKSAIATTVPQGDEAPRKIKVTLEW